MRVTRPRQSAFPLVACAISIAMGSCGGDDYRAHPEEHFAPLSAEEREARERIVRHINASEALLQDGRLTREQSDRIEAAVRHSRDRLAEFIALRSKGHNQGVVIMALGSAGAGVVGNDVTIVGFADDWLLIPIGLAAIATRIITDSPATKNEIESAWLRVGDSLKVLGTTIESIGQTLSQSAAIQAGFKRRPVAPPSHRRTEDMTVDMVPPMPGPLPAPKKEEPPKKRKECTPQPICPALGEDTWHDYCTDTVIGNEFPGCDVSIMGRAFDAKVGNTLYEVKTDDWDIYADFLVSQTLEDHAIRAKSDVAIANACGYQYEFVVGDAKLATELSKRVAPLQVVRHESKCNRKPYKAGKIKLGKP